MALDVESAAVRHNTQTFNRGRYEATAVIPNYDTLKDQARAIKEAAIAQLPELLPKLEVSVKRNGGHFFLAKDGEQASHYITQLCRERQVRLVVKGKSMTAEEIHLNHYLEAAGIEVAETDLAEFILRISLPRIPAASCWWKAKGTSVSLHSCRPCTLPSLESKKSCPLAPTWPLLSSC